MEVNINSVSRLSAAELQNAVDMKVTKLALDAAETKGAQMLLLIDTASLPTSGATSAAPAPNATTGVMLDTYA